jgi:hypothetical protein
MLATFGNLIIDFSLRLALRPLIFFLEALHQQRGGEADDEIDGAGKKQHFDQSTVAVADLVGGAEEVGQAET